MKRSLLVALAASLSLLALSPALAADSLIGKMNDSAGTPFETFAFDAGAGTNGRRLYVPGHAPVDRTGAPFLTAANPGFFTLSGIVPLPVGAATAANQTTANGALASIVTNTTGLATAAGQATAAASLASIATNTGAGATAANQATANGSLASIATNTTGLATAAGQATAAASLASIDGKTPTAGQKNMAGSSPVVLPSDQTVTIAGAVTVTGGATAANQSTANGSLASLDAKTPALTSGTLTQTCTPLPAGTSTKFLDVNPVRRSLRWQNVGTGAMTVAPGTAAVVVGAGLNYEPPGATGGQGGGTSFDGAPTPAGAFSAVSTAGTTVCAWEGN